MNEHAFNYKWRLSELAGVKPNGCKVFGTFICGGGSSMGYKLAGYDHIGGVEIDPSIAAIYRDNLHPKHLFVEDIRDFNKRLDLPEELFNLDILDGSPPCSTFSMAGDREKAWGKEKRFAEGQKLQTLDDLVFVYCDTIDRLKPKVCILENVRGLIQGSAKGYAKRIKAKMDGIGYRVQLFLLNAAFMGVPQLRERVFFIGLRNDYDLPMLKLDFNEPVIRFGDVIETSDTTNNMSEQAYEFWKKRTPKDKSLGDIVWRYEHKYSRIMHTICKKDDVYPTLTTSDQYLYDIPRRINERELISVSSFPEDYIYPSCNKLKFLVGMSVPPVMTAQIALQIYTQWLSKING